jgi:hypothetical protein
VFLQQAVNIDAAEPLPPFSSHTTPCTSFLESSQFFPEIWFSSTDTLITGSDPNLGTRTNEELGGALSAHESSNVCLFEMRWIRHAG